MEAIEVHLQTAAAQMGVPEITVTELNTLMQSDQPPYVLDVREPHEYEIANLGADMIPLGDLPNRLDELADRKDDAIVVHCRSGGRSAQAVGILLENGFSDVRNLKGGVLAWAAEVDPTMKTY